MEPVVGRIALLSLALLLGSGAGLGAQAGGPLTAVYVHGDAVPSPYHVVLQDVGPGPPCLWFHTYNFFDRPREPTPAEAPSVTLSFFTRDAWAQVERAGPDPQSPRLRLATFHTRVLLTPASVQPYVQYRKAAGMGTFIDRGSMPLASEYYLANLQIPTRLDANGLPVVRRFSGDEREQVRGALPADAPCAPQP